MHQFFLYVVTLIGRFFFFFCNHSSMFWQIFCLFSFLALNVIFYQSLLVFVSKIQKHIKSRRSKKFDRHYCILSHAYFALYLRTNGFMRSLFFMRSYHCGKNLDIYVIVVNRSSTLSWMISQWFCWSWDCIDLCLYIFPLFFFFLKSSTNVNLKMKRDNELQKPSHILAFD